MKVEAFKIVISEAATIHVKQIRRRRLLGDQVVLEIATGPNDLEKKYTLYEGDVVRIKAVVDCKP